jgi:hypothetical protein
MFNALLDYVVVVLPFLVSLLGVHMSASLSKRQKGLLVGFGLLVSALTWIQQQQSRRAHDVESHEQTVKIEELKTSLEAARISGESGQAYLRGRLDSQDKTLGAVLANSDPKQIAALLRGIAAEKSTLRRRTLAFCSEIDAWGKAYPKPPLIVLPGKPTQKEQDDQNAYFQKMTFEYYQRFGPRALGLLQEYGAKGFNVATLERTAENGYLPNNLVLELQAFANQLNEDGSRKQ